MRCLNSSQHNAKLKVTVITTKLKMTDIYIETYSYPRNIVHFFKKEDL